MNIKKAGRGFTFVELLIAVTIFSIVATGIYQVLKKGIEVWSRGRADIARIREIRVFTAVITSDLANALPYCPVAEEKGGGLGFGSDAISFASSVRAYEAPVLYGQLARVTYYLDASRGSIQRVASTAKDGFGVQAARGETVLSGVKSLSFEYVYEAAGQTGSTIWNSSWPQDASGKLPRAVKINIVFDKEDIIWAKDFTRIVFMPAGEFLREAPSS